MALVSRRPQPAFPSHPYGCRQRLFGDDFSVRAHRSVHLPPISPRASYRDVPSRSGAVALSPAVLCGTPPSHPRPWGIAGGRGSPLS